MITRIITLIILIVCSGFFSGVEIALFSLSSTRLRHLVDKNVKGAETVRRLKEDPHRLLITILIGNNLVNILAASMATTLAIDSFGSKGVGIATGIMTFLVLVFGEIAPKAFATQYAEKISLIVSRPILYLGKLLYPAIYILDIINKIIMRLLGVQYKEPKITEDELKSIVRVSAEKGGIKKKERELIHNIFKFDDISVSEIMTPKPDMFSIEGNKELGVAVKELVGHNFSRIPVYENSVDNITGVLFVKDVLEYISQNKKTVKVKDAMRPVFFVPETKKIDSLLDQFRSKKTHIALVVDKHGSLRGLVTIEDLLEQIVGEIYDETDEIEEDIEKLTQNSAIVDGHTKIKYIKGKMGLTIDSDDLETISGIILDKIGRIPKKGDVIEFNDFKVKIQEIKDHAIETVKIEKK